jgi:hypothetical protein
MGSVLERVTVNLLLCDFAESNFKHQGLVTGYQTGNDGEQQLQP